MTGENNLEYIITDEYSRDVENGLKLFHDLTSSSGDTGYLKEWSYWFTQNPFGKGLFSLAKYRDLVVGICTLIPVEMVIDNKIVRGAKAEFLAVHKDYRKFNKNLPTSINVVTSLYKQSIDYDFNIIFGVATANASVVHKSAGAVNMDVTIDHYVTFLKPLDILKKKNAKNFILKYGSYLSTGLLRKNPFLTGSPFNRTDTITEGLIRKEVMGKNELIFPSKEMLNFRFNENDFLFYDAGNGKFLVFDKPVEDTNVFLRYWTTLEIGKREFNSIFKDLYNKCKKAKARSVQMIISREKENKNSGFAKFGFIHQKKKDTLLFYHSNKELRIDLNPAEWHLTDSHRGFIR